MSILTRERWLSKDIYSSHPAYNRTETKIHGHIQLCNLIQVMVKIFKLNYGHEFISYLEVSDYTNNHSKYTTVIYNNHVSLENNLNYSFISTRILLI